MTVTVTSPPAPVRKSRFRRIVGSPTTARVLFPFFVIAREGAVEVGKVVGGERKVGGRTVHATSHGRGRKVHPRDDAAMGLSGRRFLFTPTEKP